MPQIQCTGLTPKGQAADPLGLGAVLCPLTMLMFEPRLGRARRASCLARGLDALHPDRMHMQRHDTSHQSQQGQSDATVARGCAHHPIIRPGAPVACIAELGR